MVTLTRNSALLLACVLGGCQYVSGVTELEIADRPVVTGPWDCLGQPTPVPTGTVEYAQPVRNLTNGSIPADVVVEVCDSSALACVRPLLTTTPVDGVVRLSFPADFIGYLQLDSQEVMPAIVEMTRPIGAMRVLPELRMVDTNTMKAFAAMMGVTIDETRGHALFWAIDCRGNRTAGVSVTAGSADASTKRYYVLDTKLPSVSVDRTDSSGGGGFINLPIDVTTDETFVTFDATRADTGARISQFSARIRAGHVTYFQIEPD